MSEKFCSDKRLALSVRKACEQIKMINSRLDSLQIRYENTNRDDMSSFRFTFTVTTSHDRKLQKHEFGIRQKTHVAQLKRELKTQKLSNVDCDSE
ncbi:Hypothetical predicted protein [Mytilus galloprovincialis]|uniref:Uncharacterized protein n=1 Tax=Mytilus galloprovincialis TaxID=29158 RepID=A0A8B6HKM5_MYTGA|nr:Hypothetical predicted protein [Mytilus galloprovincialis]VDI81517.1 Hypothetical predicted protein [Mytilus galloprovincialis]